MKVALIGLGMVADTHVAALRDSEHLTLHGVLARHPKSTHAYVQKIQSNARMRVTPYSSVGDIANDPEVDFAIVATPPNARQEIVTALVAEQKPILMEKPIERTWTAARTLVTKCADADVPLGIMLQHRARAATIALYRAVHEGSLGQIVSAEIRVPWWRDQSYYDTPGRGSYERDGGGVMISQAIHTLDLAIWLLGPFHAVQAMMHRTTLHDMEAEDWAGALFETQSGAVGTLYATTAAYPGEAESITLRGTLGAAHLAQGVLTISKDKGEPETFGESASTGSGADPMAFTHDWHQSVIEDFAHSLAKQRPPLATGRSALGAHAVIHAMEIASASGQRTEVPSV